MAVGGLLVCLLRGRETNSDDGSKLSDGEEKRFITWFRAYVNIATAIAILAVDFVVFPRRFAKAETYGAGLMDTGVGMYVVSMGIVSREAKRAAAPGGLQHVCDTIVGVWPLLGIGFGRIVTTKGINYQEHASEYGTHWNFFFTLAVMAVSTVRHYGFLVIFSKAHKHA